MKFYELRDDIYFPNRMYLGDISGIEDNWEFIYGKRIDERNLPKELANKIIQDGNPMDYTTSEGYNVPIVSEKIMKQPRGFNGVRFIPVLIDAKILHFKYYIMVVTNKLECVDEELSEFGKFI
jgi:hypothetical protein